jgi:hypothetical protein
VLQIAVLSRLKLDEVPSNVLLLRLITNVLSRLKFKNIFFKELS